MKSRKSRKGIKIGDKFDNFTIIGEPRSTRKRGCLVYPCKCSCGRELDVSSADLGTNRKSHCGCISPKSGAVHAQFTGAGQLTGDKVSAMKKAAFKRGYVWDLDANFLWELFKSQDFKCALSGEVLILQSRYSGVSTASLDRINPNLGYYKNNVQWIHKDINRMKNIFTNEYFIETCKKIANNHK